MYVVSWFFVFLSNYITFLVFAKACWTLSWIFGGNVDFIVEDCQFLVLWFSWTVLLSSALYILPIYIYLNIFLLLYIIFKKSFLPADSCIFLFLFILLGLLYVSVSHDFLFVKVCLSFWLVLILGISKSSPNSIW